MCSDNGFLFFEWNIYVMGGVEGSITYHYKYDRYNSRLSGIKKGTLSEYQVRTEGREPIDVAIDIAKEHGSPVALMPDGNIAHKAVEGDGWESKSYENPPEYIILSGRVFQKIDR